MGLFSTLFVGNSPSERTEQCPSRSGHYTMFGTCRCDECDSVVDPIGDWGNERRPLF